MTCLIWRLAARAHAMPGSAVPGRGGRVGRRRPWARGGAMALAAMAALWAIPGQAALAGAAGPHMVPGGGQPAAAGSGAASFRETSAFRRIILPDVLIVAPSGLTGRQIAGLRAITGVRNMITFDGAEISAAGRPASVIGVNPAQFRSWVPLRTASDQAFWTALSRGGL